MNLKFLILFIQLTQTLTEESDNSIFVVSTTKQPSPIDDDSTRFENDMRVTLSETKYRLASLEIKLFEMQKTLDKIISLLEAKSSSNNFDEMLEEKLKKVINTRTCDNENQTMLKIHDLIAQFDKKQNKQNEIFNSTLKNIKTEIITEVVFEIKKETQLNDALLNASNSLLEETKKQVTKEMEKLLKVQQNSTAKQQINKSESVPKSCKEIFKNGHNTSKIYYIQPNAAHSSFKVFCNMETKGGGWIYLLNRFDGSQDFYRNWTDYKQGFGDLSGEFWLGLEHLYELTGTNGSELLVELADWEGKRVHAYYKNFSIGSEKEFYKIKVLENYSGDVSDNFRYHVGNTFSTLDQQNYPYCVKTYYGAWWYGNGCFYVKLTGKYLKGAIDSYADGIHWNGFHDFKYSLKEAKMMIR